MDAAPPRLAPVGDAALLVEFGDAIDPAINARVLGLAEALGRAAVPGVVELLPTFRSLLVQYDPLRVGYDALAEAVRAVLARAAARAPAVRHLTIPACYEGDFAPDLAEVAAETGLAPEEVVRLHAGAEYQVFMLGFLPGFPYMGVLPARLRLPRLKTPRVRVPARSLAIAVEMTAIYPLESPGGWRLIGRVPIDLFAVGADPPAVLRPGDRVRFRPVGQAEYEALRASGWRPDAA